VSAAAVLARAYAAGLTLQAHGDRLRWRGPQPSTELLAELKAHKAELLALLAANDGRGWGLTAAERAAAAARLNMPAGTAPALVSAAPEETADETAPRRADETEEICAFRHRGARRTLGDVGDDGWKAALASYATRRLGPDRAKEWLGTETLTCPLFSVYSWPEWDTPSPGDIESLRAEINAIANLARGYLPQIPEKARDGHD
jgi:hypothetical protein